MELHVGGVIRRFLILYYIILISRIRWIQLESVKHGWMLLKAFLCLPLTVGSVGVMVMTPDRISRLCVQILDFFLFGKNSLV